MGFRTVVILNNDQSQEWINDPELGRKIQHAASFLPNESSSHFSTGRVAECVHADTQTLAVIDSLGFESLTRSQWHRGQEDAAMKLQLIKDAAEALGFKLVKKPKAK